MDDGPLKQPFLVWTFENALVRKLKGRFEFEPVATVETARVDFHEARTWVMGDERSQCRQLQGKVRPHRYHPESDRVLWDFELEDDAMLFALKFGGSVRGSVDVDLWRASVQADLQAQSADEP